MSGRGTEEVEARRAGILEMLERDYPELMNILRDLRADRDRLDWLEQWLQSPDDQSRAIESWRSGTDALWLYYMSHVPDSYGPVTVSEGPTIRSAIDAAMNHP